VQQQQIAAHLNPISKVVLLLEHFHLKRTAENAITIHNLSPYGNLYSNVFQRNKSYY